MNFTDKTKIRPDSKPINTERSPRSKALLEIFEQALTVPPGERESFLRKACGADLELRYEVASLVAHYEAGRTLDRPLVTDALRLASAPALEPGERLGLYVITRLLGKGGMGEVYLAHDPDLDRDVAIKLLPRAIAHNSAFLDRLEREARAASKLNQPNILTIHQFVREPDRCYLVTEYINGCNLRHYLLESPIPLEKAWNLGRQIALALSAAHQAGIVHRDIKPENLMVRPDGLLKVLDFGLAKTMFSPNIRPDANIDLATISTPGMLVGTVDYMSPEQVQGEKLDARTDVWSWGVVLYEMLAGRRPFEGTSPFETLTAVLNAEPDLSHLPREARSVVARALEKKREDRFADGAELLSELESANLASVLGLNPARYRWRTLRSSLLWNVAIVFSILGVCLLSVWGIERVIDSRSYNGLAVMMPASSDPSTRYLSEGLNEDLTNTLGQLGVRVITRESVARFVAGRKNIQDTTDIGRTLHVRNVIRGQISIRDNRIATSIEVADCRANQNLWRHTYEYALSEISSSLPRMRADIARNTLHLLGVAISSRGEQILLRRPTTNEEAYASYLKGRLFWNDRNQPNLRAACEHFQNAIGLDPRFAEAYSGLADCSAMQSGRFPPMQVFPTAEGYARKSIQVDPSLAEGYASLAFVDFYYNWNWIEAENEYNKAIALNPSYANARSQYSMFLAALQKFDKALDEAHRARHDVWLDPAVQTGLGRIYLFQGSYSRAIAEFNEVLKTTPKFDEARSSLASALAETGKAEDLREAVEQLEQVLRSAKNQEDQDSGCLAELAYVYGKMRRPKAVENSIARLADLAGKRYVSPFYFAVAYAAIGDRDRAFQYLHKGIEEKTWPMVNLSVDPSIAVLRGDPRWTNVIRQVGLPSQF